MGRPRKILPQEIRLHQSRGLNHRPRHPPPAAATVLQGERTEREIKLEEDLRAANDRAERAEGAIKERETKVAELEDTISQLTSSTPVDPSETYRWRPWRV